MVRSSRCKFRLWLWCVAAVVGIGIIIGALFPAGRDPFLPQSSALAMRGRIIWEMMMKNQERHNIGESWCDPCSCINSVDFLKKVFCRFDSEGVYDGCKFDEWNVAIDISQNSDMLFPVLISANFNPKFLGGNFDDADVMSLWQKSVPRKDSWVNKGVVVVRKSGMAHIIKAKNCKKETIIGSRNEGNRRVTFLTPEGAVTVDIGNNKILSN